MRIVIRENQSIYNKRSNCINFTIRGRNWDLMCQDGWSDAASTAEEAIGH